MRCEGGGGGGAGSSIDVPGVCCKGSNFLLVKEFRGALGEVLGRYPFDGLENRGDVLGRGDRARLLSRLG